MEDEIDSSRSGSGVWEKSENSRWIVVAETSHKLPRRTRFQASGSVDPSLGIHKYLNKFEIEFPRVGDNAVVVNDGTSMVRFEENVTETDAEQPGPSGLSRQRNSNSVSPTRQSSASEESPDTPSRNTLRNRRNRRRRKKFESKPSTVRRSRPRSKPVCVSVESSPGRGSPSPESLSRIVHNYSEYLNIL